MVVRPLPAPVLPPWPPTLIGTLRSGGAEQAPLLIREAGRLIPGRLGDLDPWVPPWRVEPDQRTARSARPQGAGPGAPLLAAHPATCGAVAELLGCDVVWETTDPGPRGAVPVRAHPAAAMALHALPAP
ncbi:hypothetical protein [Streptomyces sp. NPDC049887]|uniref:hypothetical protein n=1 Tax=Streptomyces sp. NPDC049887 TaxID=3155654 RepID=UPI00342D36E3